MQILGDEISIEYRLIQGLRLLMKEAIRRM